MAISKLSITEFLPLIQSSCVLDVRSPSEYQHAHIPGACSFPLFNDEERKIIGTAYKQQSREIAIKIGLDYFGKSMVGMVESIEKIMAERKDGSKQVALHCWRGGMRSAAVAWLLDLYGYKVFLLNGGYKAYRNWVLTQFEKEYDLKILSGYTGSNKTGTLSELKNKNHKVIDLEKLAGHKGSAFGNLDMIPQPGQEHFENLLALELYRLNQQNDAPIWVEGESQRIGTVNIPLSFFKTMRRSPLLFMEVPFEHRLLFIVQEYGKYDKQKIAEAILRIKKKLGGLETQNAINYLEENDIKNCFSILLKYYDKLYLKSTHTNEFKEREIISLAAQSTNALMNAEKIIEHDRE